MKDKTKKPPMVAKSPETRERTKLTAKLTLQPSANAAAVIQEYGKPFGAQELGALVRAGNIHRADSERGHETV